jgi:hypothetical protein
MAEMKATAGAPPVMAAIMEGTDAHFGAGSSAPLKAAVDKAVAAGVPWASIITTLLPLVVTFFTGGGINLQAIIAAILALINPTPVPAPAGS